MISGISGSHNLYNDPYQRSHKLVILSIKTSCSHNFMPYQKFHVRIYHLLSLTTRTFWSDIVLHIVLLIMLSGHFLIWNYISNIVCHHYVHITHVKFLQETDKNY